MKNLITIFALTLIAAIMPLSAYAEDGVFCAAVQPCDSEYNLLDEYSDTEGACFDVYASRCLQDKITAASTELKSCQSNNKNLESQLANTDPDLLVKNLKAKLKKARKKLRRSRRQAQ